MHPAPSVIIFTSLSGLGFGLLFYLGLGLFDFSGLVALVFYAMAFLLAAGGLLVSCFHLGNPQRALKAFTQWRTSWLSREAIIALAALIISALHGLLKITFNLDYTWLGLLAAGLSLGAVYCTAMIYAQLKTVPRWNSRVTPVLFLLYSLSGGVLLAGQVQAAAALLALLTIIQQIDWIRGDRRFDKAGSTLASATGLGKLGALRQLEAPHSGSNYLLKEMVFHVGRKHSAILRLISSLCLGVIPCLILTLMSVGHAIAVLAVLLHITGLFTARWLFFAQAEHVVGLYYDQR